MNVELSRLCAIMDANLGGPIITEIIPHNIDQPNGKYEIVLGKAKEEGGDIIQSNQIFTLRELGWQILTVNIKHIYLGRLDNNHESSRS